MLTRSVPEPAKHVLILIARLTVSFIMLAHVWQSFFQAGFGTATDQFTNFGIPLAIVATAFTLVVELIGSILIAVGIFVPWAAAGMAFVMYGAVYFVHGAHGVFVKNNGWELVALIAGIVLAIAAFGPGRYSLDHLVFERKREEDVPAPVDVSSDPSGVPIVPAPTAFAARPASGPRWDAPRWEDERYRHAAAPAPRWDAEAPAEHTPQQSVRVTSAQSFSLWDDGQAGPRVDAPAPRRVPSAYSNSSTRPGARHAVHPGAPSVDYADYADPYTGPQAHLDAPQQREQQH